MCGEVSGWCLKLHCCTPGLVRTSAGSTPYKGTTSPILIEPLLLLLLLLYDMDFSCHSPFLPGTSLEQAVVSIAHASSFTLQYFPYYV